jgi:hypothetical protein
MNSEQRKRLNRILEDDTGDALSDEDIQWLIDMVVMLDELYEHER